MTIGQVFKEWKSKKRRMGCVAATAWFCKHIPSFYPKRLSRYTVKGDYFEHVVATDGSVIVDLAPYTDFPKGTVHG